MVGKSSLMFVIGFGIIMGYIILNLNSLGTRATENTSWYNAAIVSKNLANIGINVGLTKLSQDPESTQSILYTRNLTTGVYAGGMVIVHWDHTNYTLRSISSFPFGTNSIIDTVEVQFNPNHEWTSFSIFAWMTNFEASNIYWVTGDSIWGRYHSNSSVAVHGQPVFFGKVTTTGSITGTMNNAEFHQGFETGVAPIEWPDALSSVQAMALNGGRYYDNNNIYIQLEQGTSAQGDGKAIIRTSAAGAPIDTVHLNDPNFNGVISGRRDVYVEGTVSGQLTIASATRDIFITNDIKYQSDITYEYNDVAGHMVPVVQGDDLLGLVAKRRVHVADNANTNRGSNGVIDVHASIFAQDEGFGAQNPGGRGGRQGTINLIGAIIQHRRNAVASGTFNWSNGTVNITSGYHKGYKYDARLFDPQNRPPGFPQFRRDTLKIVNWYESVQLPPF